MTETDKFIMTQVVISEEMKIKGVRFRKNNLEGGKMRAWADGRPIANYEFNEMGLLIQGDGGRGMIITYDFMRYTSNEVFLQSLNHAIETVTSKEKFNEVSNQLSKEGGPK